MAEQLQGMPAEQHTGASPTPSVSVVITSRGRAELGRAIGSALAQTHSPHEVIVIDDRSEPAGPLVVPSGARVVVTGGVGGNAARNRGVAEAVGELIALLDDDDYWFPWKLTDQLAALPSGWRSRPVLVSCQALVEQSGKVQPRLTYEAGSLARWLFCTTWRTLKGDSCVQTSGLMFVRTIGDQVRFDEALPSHQDWDWVLKVAGLPGAIVTTVPKPLYIYTASAAGKTSRRPDVAVEQAWARANLERGTAEYFGYFVVTGVSRALAAGNWSMAWTALRTGYSQGRFDLPSAVSGALAIVGFAARRILSATR